jgi:hypothetical protein
LADLTVPGVAQPLADLEPRVAFLSFSRHLAIRRRDMALDDSRVALEF